MPEICTKIAPPMTVRTLASGSIIPITVQDGPSGGVACSDGVYRLGDLKNRESLGSRTDGPWQAASRVDMIVQERMNISRMLPVQSGSLDS
jgi:hypothetical protein